jgi:dihydrodipicolinate synthase/N-acetylneuraminate lyase
MTTTPVRRPGGVVCPLVTPLTPDGRLDEGVLRDLIEALVPDLDGVFVLGSSGELTWLTDETSLRVATVAVDQVDRRIPVYVGIGDTGLERTFARADRLADLGADFVVVTTPFYYAVDSDRQLVEYFEAIAERAPAPVVLYNIPQNTHVRLAPSLVRTLAGHPNIVGIKDSAGDWFAFEEFLACRSDAFSVLQGREPLAAISYWSGADGLISGMANFAPKLLQALAVSIRDGRPRADSLALQAAILELAAVFDRAYWLTGLKSTLRALGWEVGQPSRPMPPDDPALQAAIDAIISSVDARWLTTRGGQG